MKRYVIWSGGCDSTLLLYEEALKSSTEDKVTAVSFEHSRLDDDKVGLERKARESFKAAFPHLQIEDITITSTISGDNESAGGLRQACLWLGSLFPFIDSNKKEHNFLFGYVYEDCFWHYRHHVETILTAMSKIVDLQNVMFTYPYEWTSKKNIIKSLQSYNIYQYTWHCECPEQGKNKCGRCSPCNVHDRFLKEIQDEQKPVEKMEDHPGVSDDPVDIPKPEPELVSSFTQYVSGFAVHGLPGFSGLEPGKKYYVSEKKKPKKTSIKKKKKTATRR